MIYELIGLDGETWEANVEKENIEITNLNEEIVQTITLRCLVTFKRNREIYQVVIDPQHSDINKNFLQRKLNKILIENRGIIT